MALTEETLLNLKSWRAVTTQRTVGEGVTEYRLELSCGRRLHRFVGYSENDLRARVKEWLEALLALATISWQNSVNKKEEAGTVPE